jgi:hypothetical protein
MNQQQATMQLDQFPASLVEKRGDNIRWIGKLGMLSDSMAQLYHFLFHLRIVMFVLADNPIGKESEASTADVGKMLNSLPRRAAFVRSGDDVGVIYTHNTPQRVYDIELGPRIAAIRDQTRAKYCHPRGDVERGFMADDDQSGPGQPPDTPNAPNDGWEEV